MQTIYVEKTIRDHPRSQRILQRFPNATVIECHHFGEVFNVKSQNFRQQKQSPSLILAEKKGHRVLPTPEGFGIGGTQNYYFSHMQNCLYDCRYCFLQGMYPSANYVLFVNYEDFMDDIAQLSLEHPHAYFFSGYDCDSLAFETISEFLTCFLPFFSKHPQAILECRTKSTHIHAFKQHQAIENCVIGFSFTPDRISKAVEHGVPSVAKRIQSMRELAERGWKVGLRFDPMIWCDDFEKQYRTLIEDIMQAIPAHAFHSVSLGPLRFPAKMYQRLVKLYPDDKLLSHPLHKREQHFSYRAELEKKMKKTITALLASYLNETILFECSPL